MVPRDVRANPWFWATLFLIPLWGLRLLDGDVYWNAVLTADILHRGYPVVDRWSLVGRGLPLYVPQIGYGALAWAVSRGFGERGFLLLDLGFWTAGLWLWVLQETRNTRTERRGFWILVILTLPAIFAMTRMRPQEAGWVTFLGFLLARSPVFRTGILFLSAFVHGLTPFLLSLIWALDARPWRRHFSWMVGAWAGILLVHPLHLSFLTEPLGILRTTGHALTGTVVEWSSPLALIQRGDALGWIIFLTLIPGAVVLLRRLRWDPRSRVVAILLLLTLVRVRFWVFYLTLLPGHLVPPGRDELPHLSVRWIRGIAGIWALLTVLWVAGIPPSHARFPDTTVCTAPHVLFAPIPEANRVVWQCRDRAQVYVFGALSPDPERLIQANQAVRLLRTRGIPPPGVERIWWPARWGAPPLQWPIVSRAPAGDMVLARPPVRHPVPTEDAP
jgi:hypothetical protein